MVDWSYTPPLPIESAPIFRWPPQPVAATLYWLRGWRPTSVRFWMLVVAVVVWRFASPSLETASSFAPGWISLLWLRNMAIVVAASGGSHLYLYVLRRQGDHLRYDSRPLGRNKRIFLFNNQTWDNSFLTLVPAMIIATAWEAVMWWAFANGHATVLNWSDNPIWFVALLVLVPVWSVLYFSTHHWVLHRRVMYKHVHSWHHRNVNIGPWSGLAMHPVEHFVLYADVLLVFLFPAHPVHLLFMMMHHTIGAPLSHTGYDGIELPGGATFGVGDFHHQLHHRLIECNYGGYESPLDELLGAFHDGTDDGDRRIADRRKQLTLVRTQGETR